MYCSKKVLKDIEKIISYISPDEEKHFAECEAIAKRHHIFNSIRRVSNWLSTTIVNKKSQKRNYSPASNSLA